MLVGVYPPPPKKRISVTTPPRAKVPLLLRYQASLSLTPTPDPTRNGSVCVAADVLRCQQPRKSTVSKQQMRCFLPHTSLQTPLPATSLCVLRLLPFWRRHFPDYCCSKCDKKTPSLTCTSSRDLSDWPPGFACTFRRSGGTQGTWALDMIHFRRREDKQPHRKVCRCMPPKALCIAWQAGQAGGLGAD